MRYTSILLDPSETNTHEEDKLVQIEGEFIYVNPPSDLMVKTHKYVKTKYVTVRNKLSGLLVNIIENF